MVEVRVKSKIKVSNKLCEPRLGLGEMGIYIKYSIRIKLEVLCRLIKIGGNSKI